MPQLTEPNRAKLDSIVQRMSDAGESDADIRFVVSDFKTKYGLPDKPVSAEDFAPEGSGESLIPKGVSGWKTAWNAVKSVPEGIIGTAKAVMEDQQPEDVALGPGGNIVAPLLRAAVRGSAEEAKTALERVKERRASEAAGHTVAALLPLVGPAAAQAGEDIGSGDTSRFERGAGNAIGLVGSMVAPAVVGKVAPKVASPLATAAKKAGPVVAELGASGALEYGAHLAGVPPGVATIIRFVAKQALERRRAAAASESVPPLAMHGPEIEASLRGTVGPEPVMHGPDVAPNAGGTLVKNAAPNDVESMLTASLEDIATRKASPRITTPPQPDLPPNYTPRTSVPKPKIDPRGSAAERARLAVEARKPSASHGPSGYFLRKSEPVSAAESAPLPEPWRAHTMQPLLKDVPTSDLVKALTGELVAQGVSPEEAIAAVSKNKDLPPYVRIQLFDALNRSRRMLKVQ